MKKLVLALVAMVFCQAARAEPATVIIGWGPFPDVPNIAVAQEKKLWSEQDLAAQIVPFVTGREAFEALIVGQLDFAVAAEFPATVGAMRDVKFAIPAILAKHVVNRLIAKGPAPLTLGQMAGKKIAVPLGTNVQFIIADALKSAGVVAELVNVSPPDMNASLLRGDVDAIMTFPAGYDPAKRALGSQYQPIALPGYFNSYLLIASEKAAGDPEMIRRVLAVLLKADHTVLNDPAEAQRDTASFVGKATSLAAVRAAWADHEFGIRLDRATLDLMVRQGTWLKEQGFIKQGEPSLALYRKLFMPGPLKALAPTAVDID